MLTKTKGIVIRYLKYQETSIIVTLYTEKYGLISAMVNGIRSPRSKRSIGYFQPFSLLDVVLYMKPNREIQRLSEYKYLVPTPQLMTDIRKSTIVLFLAEILSKTLRYAEGEGNEALFRFLLQGIITLDHLENQIENFHIHFLLKMLPYVGLQVDSGDELVKNMEMEMIENDHKSIGFISAILATEYDHIVEGSGEIRFKALNMILQYYEHHTAQIGEIKSLKVLHQVFR